MNGIYRMNEGHLILAGEGWLDSTMHVIRHPLTATSLIITRAIMTGERSFDAELEHQRAQVAAQIENYHQTPAIAVTLPLLPGCPARETTATCLREPHTCFQRQVAVLLPEHRLLMLTCTALSAFREEDEVFWQQVKNTLATD